MGSDGAVSHSYSWEQALQLSFTVASGPLGPLSVMLSFNPAARTFWECMTLYLCAILGYFDFQIGVYNNLCMFFLFMEIALSQCRFSPRGNLNL